MIDNKKPELLSMSEISLQLDRYDDIFSDFDPRPFNQRALSVDFIDEAKRASRDKVSGQIELRLMIPKKDRKEKVEPEIKRRLKEHFKKHALYFKEENKKVMKKGIATGLLGFVFMFICATTVYLISSEIIKIILKTFLEPAGWFLIFYGFDTAFYGARQRQPDIDFNEKMANAEISFISY